MGVTHIEKPTAAEARILPAADERGGVLDWIVLYDKRG